MTLPPLLLLADSAPLFWRVEGRPFLDYVRVLTGAELRVPPVKAAYLGASNGDVPEFYDIFVAAMEGIGLTRCRSIPAAPSREDLAWLKDADVILLAGGDPRVGWDAFQAHGVDGILRERHQAGAVLMGVSAGAMHLGLGAWSEDLPGEGEPFPTLGLVPYLIGVHEPAEWTGLKLAVRRMGLPTRGLGIPQGGGVLLHADGSVEPVRQTVVDVTVDVEGRLHESLLLTPATPYRGEPPEAPVDRRTLQ
ncbi:Type 1 glutamine amidotransferase-like domain-containing protein [Corallococcus carmarthensis]|uniref:Type 1 glutamine amidotransferase-like domain-containing protein n=1 Tax=Corallococcus carmarthensis TaxID=2316728 RepID=UPI00148CDD58|nr:Type 1 glutamine amidotransferase-like domain-containing protein [Corallococcus carmarthensis]NOK19304.1 type 1 glutamine amidotransferase-like domain-containing protein [Corallococcus carmarthensis]